MPTLDHFITIGLQTYCAVCSALLVHWQMLPWLCAHAIVFIVDRIVLISVSVSCPYVVYIYWWERVNHVLTVSPRVWLLVSFPQPHVRLSVPLSSPNDAANNYDQHCDYKCDYPWNCGSYHTKFIILLVLFGRRYMQNWYNWRHKGWYLLVGITYSTLLIFTIPIFAILAAVCRIL